MNRQRDLRPANFSWNRPLAMHPVEPVALNLLLW